MSFWELVVAVVVVVVVVALPLVLNVGASLNMGKAHITRMKRLREGYKPPQQLSARAAPKQLRRCTCTIEAEIIT